MRILVTGGAGFIGSHLVDSLLADGHQVTIIDNLTPQVHPSGTPPAYLNPAAEFIRGDVRDMQTARQALQGCQALVHLAGAVGVGQSQYQIRHYTDANVTGTATLLDVVINDRLELSKIVVAASMSSYGEGLYHCAACGDLRPRDRREADLARGIFEPRCPHCDAELQAIPTPETVFQDCRSVYALNKKQQEELVLGVGRTYRIPAVALRFFNVFGPRQSLSNPYNGVAAIFLSRLKNNHPPTIYEDGRQTRDFISVRDVVSGIKHAVFSENADGYAINIGSGTPRPIADIATVLAQLLGKDIAPEITGTFRRGDTRHCFADISRARQLLGWTPQQDFSAALQEVVNWSASATAEDKYPQAARELAAFKLV